MGMFKYSEGKLSVLLRNQANDQVTENLGYVNYDVYKDEYDSDVATYNATLSQALESVTGLTDNDYVTNKVTYEFTVSE